ncbi:TetR/AcrR family transcriptional regulator [Ornithinimicrobium sp. Arc0846-15]|nr:TetR/AcrR family transcriptional regulator [Ornithinimicrobium laminariae]
MTLLTSRRELNKRRTRVAIQEAVLQAAAEHGFDHVTADDVAERAGVSRRTFFNYYSGLDAVVADATQVPMRGIAEVFLARPASEDPLLALINSLDDAMPESLARWCAAPGFPEDPHHELHGKVWQRHTEWVSEMLRQRVGKEAHDLYVSTLSTTVLHVFEAAQITWMTKCRGAIDVPARQAFTAEVRTALTFARDGWRTVPPASPTT